jgi:hypothetical protein
LIFILNLITFFCLLFLVCLILFLIEIVFQFQTYDFILFLCVKFGFYSFQIYNFFSFLSIFFNFFSSLSLIILVGLEFYIVVFLDLFFMLWSNLLICVTSFESWTELTSSLFNFFYFIYYYWVHWKLILFIYLSFFSVIISISCLKL